MPKEHGSWSLAFEPVLLGLLVAPSKSGVALAVAGVAGFFARRPIKAIFSCSSPSRTGSLIAGALLILCACTGLGEAATIAGTVSLWPLLLAIPLGGLFVCFDAQGAARETAAEQAGCTAFALLPAAFATLAGWSMPAALALAGLALIRCVPTVLTIRAYLRFHKSGRKPAVWPVMAAFAGSMAVVLLAALRVVPSLAPVGACLLLIRSVGLLSREAPNWSARQVGLSETAVGIVYVTWMTFAYRNF